MKNIFLLGLALLTLASCEMDFYPSDAMNADQLAQDPNFPVYNTDGIYPLLKDRIAYRSQSGGESGNYYIRHYFQLTELRGDNVTVSGVTSDPFIYPYVYADINTEKNIYYPWWIAYRIISTANTNIEVIKEGESALNDHLLGENYFFRAMAHFHMVTLFAMPYVNGRDNMGIPLRKEGEDAFATKRATVGEVYDAVVEDLIKAKELMSNGELERNPFNDKGYVSKDAATALLARVYLYMEENEKCIEQCNELLEHAPSSVTAGYDFADYPSHTYDHPETIWCVHLEPTFEWGGEHQEASIASMYIKDGKGWGEHYWREDLIDLFRRYPNDKRFKAYFRIINPETKAFCNYDELQEASNGYLSVVYPVAAGNYCTGAVWLGSKFNADGSVTFSHGERRTEKIDTDKYFDDKGLPVDERGRAFYNYFEHKAKRHIEGRDTIYYVENDPTFPGKEFEGEQYKYRVWVRPGLARPKTKSKTDTQTGDKFMETQEQADARYKAVMGRTDNGGFYMRYYNTKFSYQEGLSMMTSPVFLRWGEVVLNRAEAYAKTGETQKAIDDVNIIRRRAGIDELNNGDLATLGYNGANPVLDLVLDERRMELCFEGHRFFDVFRNRQTMDRRYIGFHPWGFIEPNDPRIALLIPQDEINSTGIPQNPR